MLCICFLSIHSTVLAQNKKGKDKEETKDVVVDKKVMKHDKEDNDHVRGMGIKDLTEEQKQKMKSLRMTHQREMLQLKNQLNEKKAHLKTLETADNADINAINKTIEEMGSIKTDMLKKRAAHKQEVRKILTDEQRLKFDTKHSQKGKKGMKNKKMKHMKKMRKAHQGMDMEKDVEIKIIQDDDHN